MEICFSGKIYNATDDTDEEFLLHLYKKYYADMFGHLRVMFAFAIRNEDGSLFCARDFFGIKPFYYCELGGELLFGFDIRSILAHSGFVRLLNEEALEQYLSFQYSVLPETFFKGIFKLAPGHYLSYKDGCLEIHPYFLPRFTPRDISLDSAVDALDEAIGTSLHLHMAGEDEIGAFLSGGVDSGLLAARFGGLGNSAAAKKCFTVGFGYEAYDEISQSKELADSLQIEHHAKVISGEEFWEALPAVQYHMEEPLADPAAPAFYFACQEAAAHVKVALSGEGADELFGGYNIYREPLDLWITKLPMPLRRLLGKLASLLPLGLKGRDFFIRGSKTIEERFIGNAHIFTKKERDALLKSGGRAVSPQELCSPIYRELADADDITKMQHLDIRLWNVGNILHNAEKMSKAHSLELRVPYLDREVFAVAAGLPTPLRVNRGGTKFAFRRVAARYMPKAAAGRRKLGFPVPIRVWLREDKYYARVRAHFAGDTAMRYFHVDALLRLLDEHKANKRDNCRKIWTVYMFLLWHEEYFSA